MMFAPSAVPAAASAEANALSFRNSRLVIVICLPQNERMPRQGRSIAVLVLPAPFVFTSSTHTERLAAYLGQLGGERGRILDVVRSDRNRNDAWNRVELLDTVREVSLVGALDRDCQLAGDTSGLHVCIAEAAHDGRHEFERFGLRVNEHPSDVNGAARHDRPSAAGEGMEMAFAGHTLKHSPQPEQASASRTGCLIAPRRTKRMAWSSQMSAQLSHMTPLNVRQPVPMHAVGFVSGVDKPKSARLEKPRRTVEVMRSNPHTEGGPVTIWYIQTMNP